MAAQFKHAARLPMKVPVQITEVLTQDDLVASVITIPIPALGMQHNTAAVIHDPDVLARALKVAPVTFKLAVHVSEGVAEVPERLRVVVSVGAPARVEQIGLLWIELLLLLLSCTTLDLRARW